MPIWSREIIELQAVLKSLSGQLPDIEKELIQLVKADDQNVLLLYSRRCLEVIINDLCETELQRPRKTEPLKGVIDKLKKERIVPDHIITSMHGLNSLSTYGTHPKEFEPEQVRPVLINLSTVIKWFTDYKSSKDNGNLVKEVEPAITKTREKVTKPKRRTWIMVSSSVMAFIAIASIAWYFSKDKSDDPKDPIETSIAVLPSENMSPDQDNQYFADGIMEAILNHLVKIEAFRVISRTTMLQYRDHGKTMQEIGEELGVSYILEGSAQKYGQEIRITAQLINTATDVHLWSNDYTREFKEIFSLQSDIAKSIVRELKITLNADVKDRIESIPTTNIEAYNLYLKGSFELSGLSGLAEDAFRLSLKHFQLAIEKDPGFAAAYAGEAQAYLMLGSWHTSLPKADFFIKARSSALKALELDENLGDAYNVLARIKDLSEWDWDGADEMYKKAMQLNPNLALARIKYTNFLTRMGRFEESIAIGEQTIALDPLNTVAYNELGFTLMMAGRNPEALTQYLIGLELDPGLQQSHLLIAMNYIKTGNINKAVDHLEFLWNTLDEMSSANLGFIGGLYAKAGLLKRTNHILDLLKQLEKSGNRNAMAFATIYTGLGEYEEAIKYLNQAFQDKNIGMVFIDAYWFDPLHSDSRFQTILKKMKLDQ